MYTEYDLGSASSSSYLNVQIDGQGSRVNTNQYVGNVPHAMYFSSTVQAIESIGVFMRKKTTRHVLADVSNAEASDVAHAATLLDPWAQKVPKNSQNPTC